MTDIQIILLFTSKEKLSDEKCLRMIKIVREEYTATYGCSDDAVNVSIHDGQSKGTNAADVVLAIRADKKMLNEGSLCGNFKRAVSDRFSLLLPVSFGYKGVISTHDGLLSTPTTDLKQQNGGSSGASSDEQDYMKRAQNYQAVDPVWTFDNVQLPSSTLEEINDAIDRIRLEREVFDEWGLYAIMPNPTVAMSFFGPPGTGKTMAADAVASDLGRKIIRVSYADIESKYHGEGPKNVEAVFLAAEQQNAVLFIDEADSMLSKRLTNVNQGSEQAINSMRSQLLICLERFHGVVIFATNLVVNYDRAFVSRLINVEFKLPDADIREKIWKAHLYPSNDAKVKLNIPLAADVDLKALAEKYIVCGRDIRNAVVKACVTARKKGMNCVDQAGFERAIHVVMMQHQNVANAKDHTDARHSDQVEVSNAADTSKKAMKEVIQHMAAQVPPQKRIPQDQLTTE